MKISVTLQQQRKEEEGEAEHQLQLSPYKQTSRKTKRKEKRGWDRQLRIVCSPCDMMGMLWW